MLRKKLVLLVAFLTIVIVGRSAQARLYWDGGPFFSSLETWEIFLFGIIVLALTGAFLFTLVKLINFFFAKK